MTLYVAVTCGILINVLLAQGQPTTIVYTDYGPVQGYVDRDHLNRSYDAFIGIPFAESPINELRWQKPIHPEPWSEVLNATEWSAHCIQPITILYPIIDMNSNESEDCLYLNIWVPAGVEQALADPLPVMLFYYGGGYDIGTAEMYQGDELATAGNVIVVNTNYRIGSMGFFSTGDPAAPGNYGLWDAKAALEWVVGNIGYFGGNTSRITIFGHSAGAGVVTQSMLSNQTNSLFHGAIAISGSAKYDEKEVAVEKMLFMSDVFGCNTTVSQEIVDCLKLIDGKELDAESRRAAARDNYDISYRPVLDGVFADQDVRESWKDGRGSHIDFITGTTFHDSAGFVLGKILGTPFPNETNDYNKNNEELYDRWYREYDNFDNVDELIQTLYDRFPAMNSTDDAEASEVTSRVTTDIQFTSPSFYEAEKHMEAAGTGSTYFYQFKYRQSFLDGYPQWTNGSHLDDIYSVLGESFMRVYREAVLDEFNEDDKIMSEIIMKYYANFAYTGNPNAGPFSVDLTWPGYDSSQLYLLETPTPEVRVIPPEVVEHYNWILYDFMGMIRPEWGIP